MGDAAREYVAHHHSVAGHIDAVGEIYRYAASIIDAPRAARLTQLWT
jgi:hypothetical protein